MKMIKEFTKRICVIILVLGMILLNTMQGVKAYEYPTNSFYANVVDSSLGEITLYFATDKVQYLSLTEQEQIINISSSNITAYTTINGTDYTITFQPFTRGRFRLSNYDTYSYLDITDISLTNIDFVSVEDMYMSNEYQYDKYLLYTTVFGGVMICLIWFKR